MAAGSGSIISGFCGSSRRRCSHLGLPLSLVRTQKPTDIFGDFRSWMTLRARTSSLDQPIRITADTKHSGPCLSKREHRRRLPSSSAWPTARCGNWSTSSDNIADTRPMAPPFSRAESGTACRGIVLASERRDRDPRGRRSPGTHPFGCRTLAVEDTSGRAFSVPTAVGAAWL
jgi:hypothetical protein